MKTKLACACLGACLLASVPSARAYSIYPVPQKQTSTNSSISLTTELNVVISDNVDAYTVARVKEVLDGAGLSYVISDSRSASKTDVVVGINVAGDPAYELARKLSLDTSVFPDRDGNHDPHLLSIAADDGTDGLILIVGDSEGSAFYGLASLEQILEQTEAGSLPTVNIADWAHVEKRGIVEGFYGYPYSPEARLNLLDFCKRYKLNTYVYGPKGDPYHAGDWRSNYPETLTETERGYGHMTRGDVARLAEKAKECGVDFVWSVHPALQGGGINFYNLEPGVADIMTKFSDMYDLGVRHFCVSVDDMSGHPSTQGQLAAMVQEKLDAKYNTASASAADRVGGILFVPTGYALNYSGAAGVLSQFSSVSDDIDVAFTGYDCFSNIRGYSFRMASDYLGGRKPVFWWNNPVNDDYDDFLYMHGLTARWIIEESEPVAEMGGLLLNPMNQAGPSKIAIFNGADYSWNPAAFDADKSWQASFPAIMGDEELADALRVFVDMVSAYTTTETGGSDNSKPNGFNSLKKRRPEGEKYAELFDAFRNNFSKTDIPDATELKAVLAEAVEACKKLHELERSTDPDLYLFYRDMKPWFLKVERMCQMADRSLALICGGDDALRNWTAGTGLESELADYHSDPDFFVDILEGTATSPRVVSIETLPAPCNFEPFVDFLGTVIGDFTPQLPERDRSVCAISNLDDFSALKVTIDKERGTVSGLKGLTLTPGEYVGVFLNHIYNVTPDTYGFDADLVMQWSVNGKQWTDVDPDEMPADMAYLRVVNHGKGATKLTDDELTFGLTMHTDTSGDEVIKPTASTNMNTYESYVISNITDGDLESYYWSDGAPTAGESYISIDLGLECFVNGVTLRFRQNDRPSGTVAIQYSTDGEEWTEASQFTSADIVDGAYTLSLGGVKARYVRMFYLSIGDKVWVQLIEFEVDAETRNVTYAETPIAADHSGKGVEVLDDCDLATFYAAAEAGYIDYTVIENINVEKAYIYHDSQLAADDELPAVKVLADGEWHDVGLLDAPRSEYDLSELENISTIRIEWNATDRPKIHQIVLTGTPYVEDADIFAAIDSVVVTDAAAVEAYAAAHGRIVVKAHSPIAEVNVRDILGRTLAGAEPRAEHAELSVGQSGVMIVDVRLANGVVKAFKLFIDR